MKVLAPGCHNNTDFGMVGPDTDNAATAAGRGSACHFHQGARKLSDS